MKKLVFAILLVSGISINAQKHELGKVTIEELQEKACPIDTSAVAAYLFNVGETKFEYSENNGFESVTEIAAKIKIYKKEGYELANHIVKYYTYGGNSEKVDVSKAITYNLVNNKIEKTKLSSDGEFDEKINKYWLTKKITMPNVKVGSIIEYKIQIRSSYNFNFPEWEFQKFVPVIFSEYTTYIPEYYIYNARLKGFLSPIVDRYKVDKSFTLTSKERSESSSLVVKTTFSNETITYAEEKTKYTLTNVPALKEEVFVNNIDNYRATVLHELSGKRFPNRPYENFATDWESVVKKVYDSENFGDELKKTGYFEKDIDALLVGLTSQEEKIGTIFNYVKSKMNWNDSYGIYCDDGVKKAYQDKKGSAAEINLMLTAMLRYAGFEANPILVSTRSHGISLFPSQSAFNYVIAGVELQNQVVLFDATSKYSLPNILPIRDLNWFGRIIRKEGSSAQIDLMPKSNSKEVINIMASINPQGEVTGKIRDQYFDYYAFTYRDKNNAINKESYIEKLEKRHQGLEIGDFEVQNSNDLSKPIIENYSFTTNNAVEIIADKIYFSPFLFFATTENPFKQETREYPIDFVFPDQKKFSISITFPEGYAVETLPVAKAIGLPDNMGNFKYNITNNNNQIQLLYTLDINQAIIGSEYYEGLKSFYKEIVAKETEKIVLKKV